MCNHFGAEDNPRGAAGKELIANRVFLSNFSSKQFGNTSDLSEFKFELVQELKIRLTFSHF